MNKFKIGQKVKVIKKGITGVIDCIDNSDYDNKRRL